MASGPTAIAQNVPIVRDGTVTPADTEPPAPVELDERAFAYTVAELNAEDLTTRELATERLGGMPGLTLDRVLETLAQDDATVSSEQRHRLERVAARMFMSAPKAGLGVSFNRQVATRGVEIGAVVQPEFFPAARILKVGDFISEVHGHPVRSEDFLRAMILSHLPGEEMDAVIIRGDERLELALPLGNYDQLGQTQRISAELARQCVRERLARVRAAVDDNQAIGAELSKADWATAARPDDANPPSRRATGPDSGVGVSIGGSPRLDPAGATAGTPLSALSEPGFDMLDPAALTPEQRLERFMRLDDRRVELLRQIRTYRVLRDDPGNAPAEIDAVEEQIRSLRLEQRRVEEEMRVLAELDAEP